MCHDSAVAYDRAAGAPDDEIEITPEIPVEYLARELYRKSELLLPERKAMGGAIRARTQVLPAIG
jgi:hypothetical protein